MTNIQTDILNFWFNETKPEQWFQVNEAFDKLIIDRFTDAYAMAVRGEFDDWQEDADGLLALCILLDQMPRNMFRGTPKAFATDAKSLLIVKNAVSQGLDQKIDIQKRRFVYLPYEHSENLEDQKLSVELFAQLKQHDPLGYDYAVRQFDVIEKYGRFPHRNKILERDNTPEEEEYLAQPGAGF